MSTCMSGKLVCWNTNQPLLQLDTFPSRVSSSSSIPAAPWVCTRVSTQLFAGYHSTSVLGKSGSHWVNVSGLCILQTLLIWTCAFPDVIFNGKKSKQSFGFTRKARTFVHAAPRRRHLHRRPRLLFVPIGQEPTYLSFFICASQELGPLPVNITK